MNWLIGEQSYSISLLQRYNELIAMQNPGALDPYIHRKIFYLSPAEHEQLWKLTYDSPDKPFGLVDSTSTVGMVSNDASQCEKFNAAIKDSLHKISLVPELLNLINVYIKSFVCIIDPPGLSQLRDNGSGKSVHWLKGAVFLSLPKESPFASWELSLNIVHELGHQVLMVYQDCDPLIEGDIELPIYSPVRKTERPAIMSLHALVVVYFMIYFLEVTLQNNSLNSIEKEYLKLRKNQLFRDFSEGVCAMQTLNFTGLGNKLIHEMLQHFVPNRDAC